MICKSLRCVFLNILYSSPIFGGGEKLGSISHVISAFIDNYWRSTCYHPTGLSLDLHAGQLYFLCLFLFSLHSVADQIGVGPVTCQRNVPALPSISSSTRSGRAVARCRPQRAFGAAAPYLVNQLECSCASVCVCVFVVQVKISTQVYTHACLQGIDAGSGSITWPDMSCPALAAYVMSAV